jgi:predicted aminopeptidase
MIKHLLQPVVRVFATGLAILLAGCSSAAYYGQAITGHWHVLGLRRPVKVVMADPNIQPPLQQRLRVAQTLRDFANQELQLPDNGSYRNYADLQRPFLVRTVFATAPLSLQLRQWCFPIAGCVSYRGYFSATAAQGFADQLKAQGDDVYVANVPAYSTLGWFDDPLLNTFIYWPIGRLAELIFHELAHQRLYISGDTEFNESFATTVGNLGARLWLQRYGTAQERQTYATYKHWQKNFVNLIEETRAELARIYASEKSDAAKQAAKTQSFLALQKRYQSLTTSLGNNPGYDAWFREGLNNAKLASVSTYTRWVPAFEVIFEQVEGDFAAFYRAVEALGKRPLSERRAVLNDLLSANHPSTPLFDQATSCLP